MEITTERPLAPKEKKSINLKSLRSDILQNRSKYDPEIPRKLMEGICGLSVPTLVKLENEGIIHPKKVKHGSMDIVTYGLEDVHAVFKHRNISYKNKEEAEVISVFSQKGGVGKSAFTQHLASTLSLVGRVLVVDLDAQADATVLLGLGGNYGDLLEEEAELDPTIAELMDWSLSNDGEPLYEKKKFSEVVKKISPYLDVIPSDLDLGEINYSLNRFSLKPRKMEDGTVEPAELHILKEVFDQIKYEYDFIVIDCPPNIETCNVSALFASNRIVVPLELEAKSLTTMRRNADFLLRLQDLHKGFNWDKVLVVPNKFRQENIKLKALAGLEDRYGDSDFVQLSQMVFPNSSIIDKCSAWKQPIFTATSRFGTTAKSSIPQAKEFSNYFWALIHELLDIDLEWMIFGSGKEKDNDNTQEL